MSSAVTSSCDVVIDDVCLYRRIFCNICRNMTNLDTRKNENGEFLLIHTCPACGFTNGDNTDSIDTPLILSERIFHQGREVRANTSGSVTANMKMYMQDDPSIPRIASSCRNESCHGQEVMYYRTSKKDLTFVYQCVTCNQTWS